jgi:hypothetical protein
MWNVREHFSDIIYMRKTSGVGVVVVGLIVVITVESVSSDVVLET